MNDQTAPVAPQKRKPRYGTWIFVGLVVLMIVLSWANRAGEFVEIDQGRLNKMVASGAIQKMVLINNEMTVEITLKPEALTNVVYKAELERSNAPFGIEPNKPHYKMMIASVDKFYRDYEAATESIPRDQIVDVHVEQRSDLTGMLINWLFLGLLIFGIVKLVINFARR